MSAAEKEALLSAEDKSLAAIFAKALSAKSAANLKVYLYAQIASLTHSNLGKHGFIRTLPNSCTEIVEPCNEKHSSRKQHPSKDIWVLP